jgi:hypothetical protein
MQFWSALIIIAALFQANSSSANAPAPPINPVWECQKKSAGDQCSLDYFGAEGFCRTIKGKLTCVDKETLEPLRAQGCSTMTSLFTLPISTLLGLMLWIKRTRIPKNIH